ncbi:unnamed protein product, partial [Aphanomyces euteiches]
MGSATVEGDSSEKEKLAQECMDLLVKHGYHRASLEEIPIYKRVVGGLVFCLQSDDLTSVDCDILFRPVATVKERVRVAEAICHSFNTAPCNSCTLQQVLSLTWQHALTWQFQRAMER